MVGELELSRLLCCNLAYWGRPPYIPTDGSSCACSQARRLVQCIQKFFSQILFDFKRMVSYSISPKFSGKIPYVLSKPRICFLGSKDKTVFRRVKDFLELTRILILWRAGHKGFPDKKWATNKKFCSKTFRRLRQFQFVNWNELKMP